MYKSHLSVAHYFIFKQSISEQASFISSILEVKYSDI